MLLYNLITDTKQQLCNARNKQVDKQQINYQGRRNRKRNLQ